MSLNSVSRSRTNSVESQNTSPTGRASSGSFDGRPVRQGGAEALRRSSSGGGDGAATIGIHKRSLSGSTGPSEGPSTGETRRLPPKGSDAAQADGVSRSDVVGFSRALEQGGEVGRSSARGKDLFDSMESLEGLQPSTGSQYSELGEVYGLIASEADDEAKTAESHGQTGLADALKDLADDASARAKWLGTDNKAEDPATVGNILKSKSFTTDGAIKILDRHRAQFAEKGCEDILDRAVAFLEERKDDLANHTDATSLTQDGARAFMGSKGTDKHGLEKAHEDVKAAITEGLDGLDLSSDDAFEGFSLPLATPGIREDGVMTLFLEKLFTHAGIEGGPEGTKGMEKALLAGRLESINEGQEWKTVNKQVPFKTDSFKLGSGGREYATKMVDVEIKPQSQFKAAFSDMKDGGVNCHMAKDYKHVTNLAVSSISIGGTKVFEGIRHGTLSAYKIKMSELKAMPLGELKQMIKDLKPNLGDHEVDKAAAKIKEDRRFSGAGKIVKELRAAACANRARDVVTAALVKNDDKLREAIGNIGTEKSVTISIASLSLLTPITGEGKMWKDQVKAWGSVAGKTIDLDLHQADGTTKTVKVTVNALPFNFGVNMGALGGRDRSLTGKAAAKNTLLSTVLGVVGKTTWSNSSAANDKSMTGLLGKKSDRKDGDYDGLIGAWIRKHESDGAMKDEVANVKKLAAELVDVYDRAESYKSSDSEPYQAQRLIGSLMNRIGEDVAWNCKSGKDRTGQLDVFFKRDAAREVLARKVGGFDEERTDADRENMYNMAVHGGNHEMQALNTGAPGFKLGGYTKLSDLYGAGTHTPEWKAVTGASPFFGS